MDKVLADAPYMLHGCGGGPRKQIFLRSSLPASLSTMILFSICAANECQYCALIFKAAFMSTGINRGTSAALDRDLDNLSPTRVQLIVKFAQRCVRDSAHSSEVDFELVRAQGVTEHEILEIITLAALGNFLNTTVDSLKLEIDNAIA